MRRLLTGLSLACMALLPCQPALAALDADSKAEIDAIFKRLGSSSCEFQRNGTWYSSQEAVTHLRRKLDYLERRQLVDSVPSFIERAGTASSMSGKPYAVRCPGQPTVSGNTWLQEAWRVVKANTTQP